MLSIPGVEAHGVAYLRAVEALGGITYWLGDMEATETHYKRRLDLARAIGDDLLIANALYDLSFANLVPNRDVDHGRRMLEEAVATFARRGDADGVAKAQWALTAALAQLGRWEEAYALTPSVIDAFRRSDNRFGLGWALHGAGTIATRLGRFDAARRSFVEGMDLFVQAGDISGIVLYLFDFAEFAATQARTERALRLYGAMAALRDATGTRLSNVWELENVDWGRVVRELRESVDPPLLERLDAEGRALPKDHAIEFALSERDAP